MRRSIQRGFILLIGLFVTIFSVYAQSSIEVRGVVTNDEDKQPVIGATIMVDGNTSNGTATNLNGEYVINAKKGDVLCFSYIGMENQKITVEGAILNVSLKESALEVDEVVVIGYGSITKKELTGATTQIKAKSLENSVTSDLGAALQGLVPGLSVTTSSNAPGELSNIQIRGITSISGSNTPLFVVDGIPYEDNPNIASNEIASIDILKDAASASIYGTRGAAGVILITTKQGEKGKLKVAFDGVYGVQDLNYDRLPDLMNASQQTYFEILYNQRLNNKGDMYSPNFALDKNTACYMNDTDAISMIMKEGLSPEQNYNLTISGGSNEFSYYATVGLYDQSGVIENSGYRRYSTRNNFTYKKDRLRLTFGTSFSNELQDKVYGDSFTQALAVKPYYSELDRDATEFTIPGVGYSTEAGAVNGLLTTFQAIDQTRKNNFSGNAGVDYNITKYLVLNTKFGANFNAIYRDAFFPTAIVYDSTGESVADTSSSVTAETINKFSWNWYGGFNYTKNFKNKHKLTATAVTSYENYDYRGFTATKYEVLSSEAHVLNGATERSTITSKDYYNTHLFGVIGRALYNYSNRYLLSASIRADASSKFAKENRWGYFPSASVGWNIHEEGFWKGLKKEINNFKLRASYGTTGNQNISPYSYYTTMETGYDYVDESSTALYGLTQTSYVDPDIKWETSKQVNVGFDLGFLGNMFSITGDFYHTDKKDMLATVRIPASAGVGTGNDSYMVSNIGNMTNQGVELDVQYKKKFKNGLFLSANVNVARNVNEITKLSDGNDMIYNSDSWIISGDGTSVCTVFTEGYEAGAFFLYRTDGVIHNQAELEAYQNRVVNGEEVVFHPDAQVGDLKYIDSNGDGQLTTDDKTYCGSGLPEVEIGFGFNITFKGFDLSTQWFAALGGEIINGVEALSYSRERNVGLIYQWSEANPTSDIPVFRGNSKSHYNYQGCTDLWLEDGSYLRLKSITLGYTLPRKISDKLRMSNVRFYFTGQNLLTFTPYSGMNPDLGGNGLSTRGLDKMGYPISKKYLFGLKFNL